MSVTRLIAVNGNAGAWTSIAATIPAHSVQIVEDASAGGGQGLEVQFAADNFAVTDQYAAGQAVGITGPGYDGVLGYGPGGKFDGSAADVYCKVRSATATATTVRVVETEARS